MVAEITNCGRICCEHRYSAFKLTSPALRRMDLIEGETNIVFQFKDLGIFCVKPIDLFILYTKTKWIRKLGRAKKTICIYHIPPVGAKICMHTRFNHVIRVKTSVSFTAEQAETFIQHHNTFSMRHKWYIPTVVKTGQRYVDSVVYVSVNYTEQCAPHRLYLNSICNLCWLFELTNYTSYKMSYMLANATIIGPNDLGMLVHALASHKENFKLIYHCISHESFIQNKMEIIKWLSTHTKGTVNNPNEFSNKIMKEFENDSRITDLITNHVLNVPSLQCMCRKVLRCCLSDHRKASVEKLLIQLTLPTKLKTFLLYGDIIQQMV